MIDRERLVERFLNYVKVKTTSDEESNTFPSTPEQIEFAKKLVEELKALGVKDVELDKAGYVYATIPSNVDWDVPPIGFIAHMDTSPAESGENVNPIIHKNYQGGNIELPNGGIVLTPEENPILNKLIGDDIITTDGTTLLGADDKAGIAEIMTAVEYMMKHPEFKHGEIKIAFTPDEEIGKGVDYFDVKKFGAKFAYTMDGGPLGELEDENFNADKAEIIFKGINVHPGYAKGKLVNSIRMASLFVTLMNENTLPETTEKREGYYHTTIINGMENETRLQIIIRSFDMDELKALEDDLFKIKEKVLEKFPKGEIDLKIVEQYRNMKYILDEHPEVLNIALKAFEKLGIEPERKPIRGGTDGSRLTFMGVPTPNIFAGGINFHSKKEFTSVNTMEKATEVILTIANLWAEENKK
ncbi:tripeptide aminopeptidase [Thermotomaculum hydrothermale]|uniref:Peptidase T n=1 Tax=Thermotomaculum hydrothermale TaxID=981385 RepID=A0A7R6Q0S0_9BACT|nr:peptidase T [Thermotomaculum hydrothermale]BBB33463.1 tripeptide aminopeptidase [Thermotomaculum hydrothermale]